MSDVSRIVSGDVLRVAQSARHAPGQAQRAQGPALAESRNLAPAKPAQPAGPGGGTPSRDTPRGSNVDILV